MTSLEKLDWDLEVLGVPYLSSISCILIAFAACLTLSRLFQRKYCCEIPKVLCIETKTNLRLLSKLRSLKGYSFPVWGSNGHLQTFYSTLLRERIFKNDIKEILFEREYVQASDGGSIVIDLLINSDSDFDGPMAVIVPGICNSSQNHYVKSICKMLSEKMDCAVFHSRGCAVQPFELIQSPRIFTLGDTEDLSLALEFLSGQRTNSLGKSFKVAPNGRPLFLIGFSLGSNCMMKYLGDDGSRHAKTCNVIGAISSASGFCGIEANESLKKNHFYHMMLLRKLKNLLFKHREAFEGSSNQDDDSGDQLPLKRADSPKASLKNRPSIDIDLAHVMKRVASIEEFDECVTLKYLEEDSVPRTKPTPKNVDFIIDNDFVGQCCSQVDDQVCTECSESLQNDGLKRTDSVESYYFNNSCRHSLHSVSVPLMIVNAIDDPLISGSQLDHPRAIIKGKVGDEGTYTGNENVIFVTTERGGHLGWVQSIHEEPIIGSISLLPGRVHWNEGLILEWFDALFSELS